MDPNFVNLIFIKIEAIDINNEEDFNLAEIIVLEKIKSQNLKLQVRLKKFFDNNILNKKI